MKETIFAVEAGPYGVMVTEKGYVVFKDGQAVTCKKVPGLSTRLAKLGSPLKLGRARTEDFDIIYIYQPADNNFGYAINLQCPEFSEWGYAPFPVEPEKSGSASVKQGGGQDGL